MRNELLLRTRPTICEAKRITKESRQDVMEWIKGTVSAWTYGTTGISWHQDGVMHDAFIGDWVVRNAWGEFHRVTDAVLFSRFESVVGAVSE